MRELENETFVCFDLETTGLDADNDKIIEVAVVVFTFNKVISRYETLINPKRSIPQESTEIHTITDEMVKEKPTIDKVLPRVFEEIGDHTIVGHMITKDIEFLKKAAEEHRIKFPLQNHRVVDTLRLGRLYGESDDNSLQTLRKHFKIPLEGSAHRAMSDVEVNIEVFKFLTTSFKSTDAICKRLRKPIMIKKMPLGKHKGELFSRLPHKYLKWVSQWDFDQDLKYTINRELKNRAAERESGYYPFKDLL